MSNRYAIAALSGLLVLPLAGAAHAASQEVTATLKGGAETPPNTSAGTGMFEGTYDASTKKLDYTVTYSGLTGPATMAHFHAPAPMGKAAGVEIPIKGAVTSPIKGDLTLTDEQAKNLADGMTYFNIHTAANKAGEIRGQLLVAK